MRKELMRDKVLDGNPGGWEKGDGRKGMGKGREGKERVKVR